MTFLGILFGLIPGFAWLFFYLREDLHPEPKKLIILAFLSGALFAFIALFLQIIIGCNIFIDCPNGRIVGAAIPLFAIVLFSAIEEVAKFSGAFFAVHRTNAFNEPVDAMIYLVVAALGFATIENIGAISSLDIQHERYFTDALQTISLRFVGATLLHTLASAIVGYHWALGIRRFMRRGPLVWGILLATLLHASFNYLILYSEQVGYSILLVAIAGFFVLGDFEKLKQKTI